MLKKKLAEGIELSEYEEYTLFKIKNGVPTMMDDSD